jgi:hypothetical protein
MMDYLNSMSSPFDALVIFLGASTAILVLTVFWAVSNRRPVRRKTDLTPRQAALYRRGPIAVASRPRVHRTVRHGS